MNILVTGGAGFIGSNLVGRLLKEKNSVAVLDNMSTGRKEFLKPYAHKNNFKLMAGDILDRNKLDSSMKGMDIVFHLAACSDVRKSSTSLNQNVLGTYNVLESMKANNVKKIVFSSSQAVYGMSKKPVTEEYGPLAPESLYAASKISCEAFLSAFCSLYNMKSWIFRLANIVGKNQTHGVVYDFIQKLKRNPSELEILGNGKQTKSYMLVGDLIDGMLFALKKSDKDVNIFNLGSIDRISVDNIAKIVASEMGLKKVRFRYTGGTRGWIGDVPSLRLSTAKIKRLGWEPKHKSAEAIRIAAGGLL